MTVSPSRLFIKEQRRFTPYLSHSLVKHGLHLPLQGPFSLVGPGCRAVAGHQLQAVSADVTAAGCAVRHTEAIGYRLHRAAIPACGLRSLGLPVHGRLAVHCRRLSGRHLPTRTAVRTRLRSHWRGWQRGERRLQRPSHPGRGWRRD